MAKKATAKKMNETGRRSKDRRKDEEPVVAERRKVQRRRQIDPTTCERDYSDDEIEFMHALDQYKRDNGRMFPTCSELLEVLRGIGYRKIEMPVGQDCSTEDCSNDPADCDQCEQQGSENAETDSVETA